MPEMTTTEGSSPNRKVPLFRLPLSFDLNSMIKPVHVQQLKLFLTTRNLTKALFFNVLLTQVPAVVRGGGSV